MVQPGTFSKVLRTVATVTVSITLFGVNGGGVTHANLSHLKIRAGYADGGYQAVETRQAR